MLLNVFEVICAENSWHGEVNEISEETEFGPFIARETRRAVLAMSALRRAGDAYFRFALLVTGAWGSRPEAGYPTERAGCGPDR